MKIISQLSVIFIIGGTLGWLNELIFRRIVHKKWVNPGFLTGPCLPLYGCGLLLLYLISSIDFSFISSPVLQKIVVVLAITVAMTGIEYITGLIFIKGMNLKLWDYSDRFGNIQGIICPLFTLCWGVLGVVYYLFVHKYIAGSVNWISENPIYSYLEGLYFGVFIVDMCYSFHVVTKIKKWAKEHNVVVKYEDLKLTVKNKMDQLKKKASFIFMLKNKNSINEELDIYNKEKANKK